MNTYFVAYQIDYVDNDGKLQETLDSELIDVPFIVNSKESYNKLKNEICANNEIHFGNSLERITIINYERITR